MIFCKSFRRQKLIMKILFCNKYNFPFSGTEKYLFELMELLRTRGHEVALFSMADSRGAGSEFRAALPPVVDFKSGEHSLWQRAVLAAHAVYSVEARRNLRQILHEFQPDIAHVRNIYHHLSPSILWELRRQRVPVLYHLNDFKLLCPSYNMVRNDAACQHCRGGRFWHVMTSGCYSGPRGSTAVLAAEAYLHKWFGTYDKCVTQFLAPSHFVRRKLIENGWNPERVHVLYHPQALSKTLPNAAAPDAPILYFGRLSREKGLVSLLHAMQELPSVRLQIAGDGPQRADLDNIVRRQGLSNVELLGHLEGKPLQDAIAGAKFTVLPSLAYETLGKSILESFAHARPVIATDLGSRRELIAHGRTGLLYPPGDANELRRAISFLDAQPELIEKMGMAGYDFVRRKHSPEEHIELLLDLYSRLGRSRSATVPYLRNKPLRVAFIGGRGVASKYSGIETWYEEVGRRLASAGHQITIYCRNYFTPPISTYKGMRMVRLPTIRTKHLDTLVHTALSTVCAMFGRYDVIHFHALGPALFSWLPRLTGKKTVVSVQGLDWQRKKWGRFAATVLRFGERAAVALPNATIVVSRTLQDYYRTQYGADTAYIPNGTELREPARCSHLSQWGLKPDRYILFLGRFSPEKNCDLLVRAFEPIRTDVKLVLAGGSSHTDDYTRGLLRHQSTRAVFLDWVQGDALDQLLTNAMLFVLPSDLEGLSLALLDAMGAGVCVLASDVPENRELVDGAGYIFRRGDEQDLRAKLEFLINNQNARQQAARVARERIRKGYLWDYIAQQVAQEYRSLIADQPATDAAAEVHKRAA